MKKLVFAAVLSLIFLSSCNFAKSYKISGEFDIPMELNLGDTIIERDLFDGGYVYMLELDGTPIDSALIEDEKFVFEGKIKEKDACFVYVANEFAQGIVALEPGEIHITIEQGLFAYGTPTNDAINDVDARIDELAQDFSDKVMALSEDNANPSDSILMPIYNDFNAKCELLLDSLYEANKNTLAGIYIVNIKTSSAQTLEELEERLEGYDDYVTKSPVMRARRQYLYEAANR